MVLFTSANKCYIWASVSFRYHFVYKMLFPNAGILNKKNQDMGERVFTFIYGLIKIKVTQVKVVNNFKKINYRKCNLHL